MNEVFKPTIPDININSKNTYTFLDNNVLFGVRFGETPDGTFVDFAQIDKETNKPVFSREFLNSFHFSIKFWSKLFSAIQIYIQTNSPTVLFLFTGDTKLFNLYKKFLISNRNNTFKYFRELNNYTIKEYEFGFILTKNKSLTERINRHLK